MVILTDINLKQEKSGIDLGKLLHEQFHIPFIYITSHTSPQIFEKAKYTLPNAYIVKPFKTEDLIVAIELALFNSATQNPITTDDSELIVKEGRVQVHLACDSIVWLETDRNYTTINLINSKRRVVRIPISELQQQLSSQQFIRIHKSYVINVKHITEIKSNSVIIKSQELPIGRAFQSSASTLLK